VYKTTNGGKDWEKVLFVSNETGFADLEIHPKKRNVLYAAAWKAQRKPWTIISGGTQEEGGIYKSTNGGKDWEKLGNGLPSGLIGKIDLAVSPDNPKVLYAVIEAPDKERGLYRSDNEGKSFKHVSDDVRLVNRPFYYTNIEVDPNNVDIVYSNANPLLKSTNGGNSWRYMSVPHGDNHDIWINPKDSQLIIQANDGGANVSFNGGKTWSSQFNQPTAELYQVEVDDQYPYWLYAGQQDNYSTIAVPSYPSYGIQNSNTGYIINTGGCETGPAVPKPGNANIVYANCKGRFSVFNKATGTEQGYYVGASNIYGHNPKDLEYRFQRVAPIEVSPHDPDVVYHGSQYLHKTSNGGQTWETISPDLTAFEPDKQVISGSPITRDITGEEYYSTLYSIQESPVQEGLIWTGSNDGVISVTTDGGKNWKTVTPNGLPKGGRVESIHASEFDSNTAYIAIDRHLLGDSKPYLYKTNDLGASWQLLSNGTNGIPADFNARVLREDPVRKGLLYAGTEYGLFISLNDGATWQAFQQNLPVTPITDLKIFRGDLIVSTMGRGFWILDDITLLRDPVMMQLGVNPILFKPNKTIRYRYPKTSYPQALDFPETAVTIDYYLPKDEEEITLSIVDYDNNPIVTIVGNPKGGKDSEEVVEDMNLSQTYRYVDRKLSAKEGLHRFKWNMRMQGAWHKNKRRRYVYGPLVAPGKYKAILTVGKTKTEQSFKIFMDPRVENSGVSIENIQSQIEFQKEVIDLLSEARQFHNEVEDAIAKEKKESTTEGRLAKLEDISAMLTNDKGAYPQQMLLSQIGYLLNMVSGADQLPGQEAEDRLQELTKQFKEVKENLD